MSRDLYGGVTEQAKASRHRLDDAHVLLTTRFRGSMYLAGYAVECLLKAKLMRACGCRTLADLEKRMRERGELSANTTIFSHQLEVLLGLTGGTDRLRSATEIWHQFVKVNRWTPAWRYSPDLSNHEDADSFFRAVKDVLHWIEFNL